MKRTIVFVMLFVFLGSGVYSPVSAGLMGTWVPTVRSVGGTRLGQGQLPDQEIVGAMAQLNADSFTFEGLLTAYSVNKDEYLEEQVLLASEDISTSNKVLNGVLTYYYKYLNTEQQSNVEDAYLSLGSYFEKLAQEANLIFQDEDGKAMAIFEVQEVGIIFGSLPNQVFVGSALSST